MSAHRVLGLIAIAILSVAGPVLGQDTRIRTVLSGSENLIDDLNHIVQLSPNKLLQKERKNIEEILREGFLMGVHPELPIRLDLVIVKDESGTGSLSYEPSVPIAVDKSGEEKFDGKESFLTNVEGLYKVKKTRTPDIYELSDARKGSKPFYMKHHNGYATFGRSEKRLKANLPNPQQDVASLLDGGRDAAAEISNKADGIDARRADFQSLRKELEAAIKFKRNEDKSEFELRKLGVVQFFDEIERFVVESERLFVGWTTADQALEGKGELELTALAGTSLLQSIQILSVTPSHFANVALHDKPALAGKLMFPFDSMRKDQAKARHDLLLTVGKGRIDKSESYTAEEKAAAKQALELLLKIFDATVQNVGIDGFVDLHDADNGKLTGVAGLRAEDSKSVEEILGLLPKISSQWKVQVHALQHGGVDIHEVTISDKYKEEFESLFGAETTFYIGTSDKAVWGAAGKGALDELKGAIDAQAKPAPELADPVFASVTMRFGPWVKVIDIIQQKHPLPPNATKVDVTARKERDRLRYLALEAFEPGTELLTATMARKEDRIVGEMTINQWIFGFLGSLIADISKENFH